MRVFIAVAAIAAVALPRAAAAKAPRQPSARVNALDQCRQLTDPAQRLACFDKAAGALVDASRTGEVNVVDRGQLREARRSLFGFSVPKLPFFSGDESAADAPDTLETTIKSVHDFQNGMYQMVVTEGNAIWETNEERMGLRAPRPGQKVSIRRGPLGGYFIRINGQRGVKGRRIG
jgi:hypothetical protein